MILTEVHKNKIKTKVSKKVHKSKKSEKDHTSVFFILKHFLHCLSPFSTKVFNLSPMLWNMTRPNGIPANA
jgi:hypothetical protein